MYASLAEQASMYASVNPVAQASFWPIQLSRKIYRDVTLNYRAVEKTGILRQ